MRKAYLASVVLLAVAAATWPGADAATKTQKSAPAASEQKDKTPPADGTPAVVVDDNKVESLLGKVVKSEGGDNLGQITDILVGHSGDVRAAVIDFGGFLGVGTRKVAVAWGTLRFSQDSIVLNMTRDELRVTPEYREGEPVVIVGPPANQASGSSAARAQPPK